MSQQQRRRVAISSGSIPVIPVYGNTFDMLTSEFNFMDDIRFKPLDVLLENYGTLINAYESYEWDSVYRQNKEMYSKMESEDLLAKVQRRHFPYRNEVIVVNPKYSYTTAFTKLPDYPVSLTSFNSGSPLIIKKFKVRLPITEAAVTLGMNYIEDFYSPIIDEVTGVSSENPTVSQFYEDMKHRDEYLKSQFASMVSIQMAFLEELSADPYPGYVRYFTNEDYYKSLWSSRETGDFMYKVYDDNKNSIIPSDVLPGITDIHYLSYINRLSQIFGVNYSGEPSMIGNPGDIISYEFLENETKQYKNYAWDPQNNEWSAEFFDNFISPVLSRQMDNLISKMKAKNEFLIGLRPFMMAANYLPSFKINRDLSLFLNPTTTTTTTTEAPANSGVLTLPFEFESNNGGTVDGSIGTSTGYFKVDYWNGESSIYGNGNIEENSQFYFSKQFNSPDVNNGQIVITSCTSDGTPLGDILLLQIWNNYLNFDVTSLTSLTNLYLATIPSLTSIDLTGLSNLRYLDIEDMSSLTSIDITGLSNLQNLAVYNMALLTSIDLTGLSNLRYLDIEMNSNISTFTSIDITSLTNLFGLWLYGTQLTSLDVTGLTNLTSLSIGDNPLLTSIDITGLVNLHYLNVANNISLTSMDVTVLTNLTGLNVDNTPLTIDLTGLSNLLDLSFSNMSTPLDVTGLTSLRNLWVNNNSSLTPSDIIGLSDLTNLTQLQFANNPLLTSIDITGLINLHYLNVSLLPITSLDVTGLSNLNTLIIDTLTSLTSLDITGLSNLTSLYVSSSLTSFDLTSLTNLQYLGIGYNRLLTSIDVTSLTNLTQLQVYNNPLITSLDVTGLSNLNNLTIYNNSLDSSDIDNMLIELDVNGHTNGYFYGGNVARTSDSDTAYANLISKYWGLQIL